jgi:hypothetical protein
VNGQPISGGSDRPQKETPAYKKWWFWAVVAVGGYVVYELATTSSTAPPSVPMGRAASPPGGVTLLSW